MPLLTLVTNRWELLVNFAGYDTNGKLVTRDQKYDIVGADYAAVSAARDAFLTDLGAVTEGQIIGSRLTEVEVTTDVIPTTEVNLYKVAVVSFQSGTDVTKKLPHNLIAPKDAILADGSTIITSHADVGAWVANYVTGGNIRISDGEYISSATNPILASRVKSVASGKTYG